MRVREHMGPAIALWLVALLLAITLAQAYFIPLDRLQLVVSGEPEWMLVGAVDVLWWCAGAGAVVGMLLLKRASRWLLLGFFLLGVVGSWVAWVPYVGSLAGRFDTVTGKFLVLQLSNVLVLALVFWLFRKSKNSNQ
jgi:hypothetical protein